ncbi:MAG TPA: tripartite tricarboxylate transporter substrate binding protein [Xanthobacteraceae bacterium]|nr:tripartite tricarboxylate transporter substrate binding protein [Xanthobacteraceae bacterium]
MRLAPLPKIFAAACALAFAATAALAQNYPNRPITLIVPSSAGGPADTSARMIVDRLSVALGQQVVIETAPGAGGTIGMGRVARAAPDGYTLLIHQNGFAITPAVYDKLPFDTAKDFVTVGLANQSNTFIVGRKSLPANNFAELVAWMRGPGKPAKYGHPGKGTNGHLQGLMFTRAIGAEVTYIPYRGIAPAVNDLLGEHIDVTQVGAAVAAPHIKSGNMKVYASTGIKRSPDFPDVPIMGEVGHKELERPFWHAIFAPAGTPRPVLERLNAALRETLKDPEVQKIYARSQVESFPEEKLSIEAANAFVKEEIALMEKVVRENDVKID